MKSLPCLLLCALTLLTACGGGDSPEGGDSAAPGGATVSTPLPSTGAPQALTVSGTVVSASRQPISGLAVLITGRDPVNTDAAGRFTFTGVTPPYDLTIVDAANKEAAVYRQLRRADPTLVLYTSESAPRTAHLQGSVSGGHYPQASDELTVLTFLGQGAFAQTVTDASGAYVMGHDALQWYGPSALSGTLHALQLSLVASTGLPSAYKGYAAKPLTVADGTFSVAQDLGLVPITSSSVSGTVTTPAGYALQSKGVGVTIGGALAVYFPDASSSAGFSYVVPQIPDAQVLLAASVSKPGGGETVAVRKGIAPGTSQVSLVPQAPPEAILPAEGATGVGTQMRFSWTAFARGVHLFVFEPVSLDAPRITVVTTETSATLPDLAALGLALPRSTRYVWRVEAVGPLVDVDAAASLTLLDLRTLAPSVQELQEGVSVQRSFVTAP
jgi:hypothetical protein